MLYVARVVLVVNLMLGMITYTRLATFNFFCDPDPDPNPDPNSNPCTRYGATNMTLAQTLPPTQTLVLPVGTAPPT